MSLPGQNKANSDTVCKLNRSIYGFKKSPKCWNMKFNSVMENHGFIRSENDFCLYTKISENCKIYVLLYVNDILILGTDEGLVKIVYIKSEEQIADLFTKTLGKVKFIKFVNQLGLKECN